MSSAHVETVRRLVDAFNGGDFAALNELDTQVELQDEPRTPGAGWSYGYAGAVSWAVRLWQSFGQVSLELADPVDVGEAVVSEWRAAGKGKRSGVDVAMAGHCLFDMERGKVRRVEFFETRRAAFEAASRRRVSPSASGPSR